MWSIQVAKGQVELVDVAPPPAPAPGEVTVRTTASSVNGADVRQKDEAEERVVAGVELAGEVVSTGAGVAGLEVGDQVIGLSSGAHRELVNVPAAACVGLDGPLDAVRAGVVAEAFTTAHDALITTGEARSGDRVLVRGAAGGVGTAAVLVAEALGCEVVAHVRDPAQIAAVEGLSTAGRVHAHASGEDVAGEGAFDVVLELVGAPNLRDDLALLAPRGRIVVIGVGAGREAAIDLRTLMRARGAIHGSTLKTRTPQERGRALEVAWRFASTSGLVERLPIEASYTFQEAPAAFARFEAGGKLGKVSLVATDDGK